MSAPPPTPRDDAGTGGVGGSPDGTSDRSPLASSPHGNRRSHGPRGARSSQPARRRPSGGAPGGGDRAVYSTNPDRNSYPAPYLHPHVLVLDEIGYLSHAADAANVLYRLVNDRYLRGKPILVTTNKPLAAWGQVLHDGDLAEAILDRLLERDVHFEMRGRSYRTRHLKDRPADPPDE